MNTDDSHQDIFQDKITKEIDRLSVTFKTKIKNFIGVDYFLINVIDSSGEKWIKIYDSIDFNVVSNFDIITKGKK